MIAVRPPHLVLALVFVAGCPKPDTSGEDTQAHTGDTDTTGETDTANHGPVDCAPLHSTLAVSGSSQTIQFSATMDEGSGPVPTAVNWVIDGPGTIEPDGLYTSPADFGGVARITAVRGTDTALCTVDIEAAVQVNSSGNPAVPDAFAATTPTESDACAPDLLYPLANSAMPGSFAPPLIQWRGGGNMYALELSSQWTTIWVYTSSTQYQPSVDAWYGLTHYDPDEAVHIRLTGGNWTGSAFSAGTCTSPQATDIQVTDGAIDGSIVYWAPPATKRLSFSQGVPASNEVLRLAGGCDGCHSVNLAKPNRLAYGPNMPGTTNLVDLNNMPPAPDTVPVLQSWGNSLVDMRDFAAPDRSGEYIVVTKMGLFAPSTMSVHRQDTGAVVSAITTSRTPTMPNWSPDGTKLVYAGCDNGASLMGASNCDLYVQTWNATTLAFSGETLIATHPSGQTLYYPTFSPDSSLVAYNAAVMTSGPDGTISSYANPKARMMIVGASGGNQLELTAANGTGDLTNSWPRWAPAYGTYAWLAVSSKRAYGTQVDGLPQLWVTAIDLDVAASGVGDPSKPPTWIPGQLITEGNHTPTWLPNKDNPPQE